MIQCRVQTFKCVCPDCSGTGRIPCDSCDGDGYRESDLLGNTPFIADDQKREAFMELRQQALTVARQAKELTEMMPHNAQRYQKQAEEIINGLGKQAAQLLT